MLTTAAGWSEKPGPLHAACGQLGAFVNIVNAQAGKKLTITEAQLLVQTAMAARAVLGCAR